MGHMPVHSNLNISFSKAIIIILLDSGALNIYIHHSWLSSIKGRTFNITVQWTETNHANLLQLLKTYIGLKFLLGTYIFNPQ